MEIGHIIAVIVFVLGYLAITLEHKIGTHKSAISLTLAGVMWVIALFAIGDKEVVHHAVVEAGGEVFEIVAFLLAAMSLVEILIHYRFFDIISKKIRSYGFSDSKQFAIILVLTFFFSALLDNLTVTIVMIQISRKFFKGENLLLATAGIVITANAGGAWSPVGDVTTIMLWLAKKFTSFEIITQGFIPSAVLALVSGGMMIKSIGKSTRDDKQERVLELTRGEKLVIASTLLSFTLPLIMNTIGLPPYIGLLLGLGFVWMLVEFIKTRSRKDTHLTASIDALIQKTDIASIQFFIGILLAVSALHHMGILENISKVMFGENPELARIVTGNAILGLLSSIVDNVPLTALAIDIIHFDDPSLWVLTAIAVGTGGSALVIGSVAGIIAMGMVKELTFNKYLEIATKPAVVGYIAAVLVWYAQYSLFLS